MYHLAVVPSIAQCARATFVVSRFCKQNLVPIFDLEEKINQEMEELVNDEKVLQREISGPILGKALEF